MASSESTPSTVIISDYDSKRELQEWAQSTLTNLYSLDQALQIPTLFTPDAELSINGDKLTLEKFEDHIKAQNGVAIRTDISWTNALAISGDEPYIALFEGSYTLTRSLRMRLRAAPMQVHQFYTSTHYSHRVVESGSERKFASLIQTETYERPPVHLPPVGAVSPQGASESNEEGA
ncbi:hypothetical protein B0F90DRAFT_1824043 [Multifurca ochricompacta]|uniref:Uncharacterized protein n=1 Tax=Multifurca ochricompacta TaxID=376703 RepID=A0AAD4QHN9_9AGAM|nr:hypothetical protein B0F90DRAFT_1824043 [Multifurca ochricompacta]